MARALPVEKPAANTWFSWCSVSTRYFSMSPPVAPSATQTRDMLRSKQVAFDAEFSNCSSIAGKISTATGAATTTVTPIPVYRAPRFILSVPKSSKSSFELIWWRRSASDSSGGLGSARTYLVRAFDDTKKQPNDISRSRICAWIKQPNGISGRMP